MLFTCPICSQSFEKAYQIFHHKDVHDKSLYINEPFVYKAKTLIPKKQYKTFKVIKSDHNYYVYYMQCSFKFDVFLFPNEFDLSLVKQNGWFSYVNKTGAARDHMLSVSFGYKNNIDPNIIGHPANCKVMLQRDNAKKYTKCSINLIELMKRIDLWNEKYPEFKKENQGGYLCLVV